MVSYESPKGDSEALKSQLEGVMGSERAHLLRYAAATAIKTCRSSKSRVYEKIVAESSVVRGIGVFHESARRRTGSIRMDTGDPTFMDAFFVV